MPSRTPRRSKLAINDMSVLAIWVLLAYKAEPERAKEAYSAMWAMIPHFLPSTELEYYP